MRRRLAVLCVVGVATFGVAMIPSQGVAQAGAPCGGIPIITQICSGLSTGWNFVVGITADQLKFDGKVVGFITKQAGNFACKVASGRLPIGAGVVSNMCAKIIGKLTGSSPSTSSATPSTSSSSSSSSTAAAAPPQGSPAAALSTSGLAAVAGAATLFVAHTISQDTHVQLTSGFFPSMYRLMERYAWELAVLAIILGALVLMVTAWMPAAPGQFGLLLARVPMAGLLMLVLPVLTALMVGLVDALCGDVLHVFHGAVTMLHVLGAGLAVLAGSSAIAHLTHHATIAHVTGTGAWFLAGFGLLSTGAIALELILREVAIYLSLLIVPLALIGEIYSPLTGWARGLLKALFVLIIAKFVLVLGLAMAGALVTSFSVINAIVGLVTLLVIAFVPGLIYGALIRVEQAWHAGAATAGAVGPATSTVASVRQAHARVRERFGAPATQTQTT